MKTDTVRVSKALKPDFSVQECGGASSDTVAKAEQGDYPHILSLLGILEINR
jgi:hypothetical protein